MTSGDAEFAVAVQHHQAGRFDAAAALYEQILATDPGYMEARRLLAVLHFQRGNAGEAETLLRQVIATAPENAKAYDNLAFVLHGRGHLGEAVSLLRKAAELAPDNDAILFNLGNLYAELGRTRDAIQALQRAAAANGANIEARQRLATELLKTGNAPAALRHLEACVALGAADSAVYAHIAIALADMGDESRLNALVDLERFVVCRQIGDRHGFASLGEFNAALASHIAGNSTLHDEGTTVNGMDTFEVLTSAEPHVVALKAFIEDEIGNRLQALPDAPHPFAQAAPKRWRIESWGVKMWRQGHQVTHIHKKAWLSGVYYVQLPEIIRPRQKGHDGWIEFGQGPADLYAVARPPVRLIQPIEGMLVTFPSYIWHRTLPFESKRDRISIAFDAIAAD